MIRFVEGCMVWSLAVAGAAYVVTIAAGVAGAQELFVGAAVTCAAATATCIAAVATAFTLAYFGRA